MYPYQFPNIGLLPLQSDESRASFAYQSCSGRGRARVEGLTNEGDRGEGEPVTDGEEGVTIIGCGRGGIAMILVSVIEMIKV